MSRFLEVIENKIEQCSSGICYFCFLLSIAVTIEVRGFEKPAFVHFLTNAGFDSDFCILIFSEILCQPTDLSSNPLAFSSYMSFSL